MRSFARGLLGPSGLALAAAFLIVSCGGGGVTSTPPPPPPLQQAPPPLILRTLYRVLVNGTDRMTTFGPNERNTYPLEAQVYYVPDAQASDRTALNRMVNAGDRDHADATGPMNGYLMDEVIGYPWSASSFPGLTQILEGVHNLTGDYAMMIPQENLSGYTSQPLPVYGYPRYGNVGEVLLTLSAGDVKVESNAVAGGVVWRWFWNGVQFINNGDYGREIQAAFYYPGNDQNLNPNEAGDSSHRDNPATAHGSPLLRFENQGTTQFTRAVPLNWLASVVGGDQDHPVIWNHIVLGKDLALNFKNMGPVAQYTTHMVLPTATFGGLANPAGYLVSSFNRFWTYDASSKTLEEVTTSMPDGCTASTVTSFGGHSFSPNFGGIIMSDASGANAMGIYGVDKSQGGSITYLAMWKFFCWGDGPGEAASDTTAWSAVTGNEDDWFPAGESTYNVYIITDTLQNVTTQMDRLYTMGVR
jgi:hypothetical protein